VYTWPGADGEIGKAGGGGTCVQASKEWRPTQAPVGAGWTRFPGDGRRRQATHATVLIWIAADAPTMTAARVSAAPPRAHSCCRHGADGGRSPGGQALLSLRSLPRSLLGRCLVAAWTVRAGMLQAECGHQPIATCLRARFEGKREPLKPATPSPSFLFLLFVLPALSRVHLLPAVRTDRTNCSFLHSFVRARACFILRLSLSLLFGALDIPLVSS
jgi:hypothetical protein